jgi:maltooligosyltrehalose trehalohydrolase
MLFQGEEWAASSPFQYFADHEDRELARLVSEGRRREFSAFGWAPETIPDPESEETYEASKLKWNEVNQPEHAQILEWYRALICLRRATPCLNNGGRGNVRVTFDEEAGWLRMECGTIAVLANLGAAERTLPVPQSSVLELASHKTIRIVENRISLPRDSIAVLSAPDAKSA